MHARLLDHICFTSPTGGSLVDLAHHLLDVRKQVGVQLRTRAEAANSAAAAAAAAAALKHGIRVRIYNRRAAAQLEFKGRLCGPSTSKWEPLTQPRGPN
mmetsp:Transcript_16052/g.24362  ORF Transcript_16052/g.24362 Transcript_16052/m.24362 type:complete len:99 (+) Transcript_16052:74-370(+)